MDTRIVEELSSVLRYIVATSLNKRFVKTTCNNGFLIIFIVTDCQLTTVHSKITTNKSLEEIHHICSLYSCDHHQTLHKYA